MADPRANLSASGASWYASRMAERSVRGPLSLELDVDVCVIGAGLAGLTVALEVAKHGWSVAVLEGRRIAWNASGRNTGIVTPGYAAGLQPLVDKVGPDHAKSLWSLSESGAEYVRRIIRQHEMRGAELEEGGWLRVSQTANESRVSERAEWLKREFGTPAEFWPGERVRTHLRSTHYFAGMYLPNAFSINPLGYALDLAAAAEAAGVRIFEETPALEIDPAGVRKRITTPAARVRAGHVVLAGNIHIGGLMPDLASTLLPIWAYSVVTKPLGDRLREAVNFGGAVTDNELSDSEYRVVGGDRLLWSGRCSVSGHSPVRQGRGLLAQIQRTYPQLGKVEAEHAWNSALGATVHLMPQIGELSQGVWLLSGFGAHGLNTTAMGGELVSRAILEGDQTWKLFQPFDLVWTGGKLGRAVVQAGYWAQRAREQSRAVLARRSHRVTLPELPPLPAEPEVPPEPQAKPRQRRRKASSAADSPVSAN